MADEMPSDPLVVQLALLIPKFLHEILSEIAYPAVERLTDDARAERFGDREQCNIFRISSATFTRPCDASPHMFEVLGDHNFDRKYKYTSFLEKKQRLDCESVELSEPQA
jgi:hypothetical protein